MTIATGARATGSVTATMAMAMTPTKGTNE
jgi:hypothetical protein